MRLVGTWSRRPLIYRSIEMNGHSPAAEIARSPVAWERLAKNWLVEVIERSPLDELEELPLSWIAQEAAPLIAEILGQLSDPGTVRDLRLSPAALERAASLARERDPDAVARRLPGEFAALQSLLIDALDRELPERDRREFTRAVTRLAEVFGAVQAAAMGSLVGHAEPGPLPPDASEHVAEHELDAYLDTMVSQHQATGLPFAIAHFEIGGVERISKGYGEDAADRMVAAVVGVLEGHLSGRERSFRAGPGQLVAVIPSSDASDLLELAASVADTVERSQAGRGPRVEVAVGLASCPHHATEAAELRDAAEEAAWAARASGKPIAMAGVAALQDP
jgi:GGDEF domain-containing protein